MTGPTSNRAESARIGSWLALAHYDWLGLLRDLHDQGWQFNISRAIKDGGCAETREGGR